MSNSCHNPHTAPRPQETAHNWTVCWFKTKGTQTETLLKHYSTEDRDYSNMTSHEVYQKMDLGSTKHLKTQACHQFSQEAPWKYGHTQLDTESATFVKGLCRQKESVLLARGHFPAVQH